MFALIADVHGRCAGRSAEAVISAVREIGPDLIFVAGDMIRCDRRPRFPDVLAFFRELRKIATVYYVYGNHEQKYFSRNPETGVKYEKALGASGVVLLRNQSVRATVRGFTFRITGLELPGITYRKFRIHRFSAAEIETLTGKAEGSPEILLVHNPAFGKAYFAWGADLVLAGHYHGGLIRIGRQALLSPYGFPLPRYGYGLYRTKDGRHMIVTGGAGDHRISLRVGNPHEAVSISEEGSGSWRSR